jgi:hypothetical protein
MDKLLEGIIPNNCFIQFRQAGVVVVVLQSRLTQQAQGFARLV